MFGNNYKIIKALIFSTIVCFIPLSVLAQETFLKDSDFDGISDESETNIFFTDPKKPDSDDDGVLDYQEILDNTDPNDLNSNKILEAQVESTALIQRGMPVMWYIGRVSGIASFIMFTFVILFGLTMTSKILLKYRIMFPGDALVTHMFTASFIAFTLLILHISSFFFDEYIKLSIGEVCIPFLFNKDLTSSLGFRFKIPVAFGVIALYLSILLLVTSRFRNKLVSNTLWRKLHYLSFLFYILFLLHGILTGTDTKEWWMITIYLVSFISVLSMVLLRIFGKKFFLPATKKK